MGWFTTEQSFCPLVWVFNFDSHTMTDSTNRLQAACTAQLPILAVESAGTLSGAGDGAVQISVELWKFRGNH